jgi:phage baseplate assembly protein V
MSAELLRRLNNIVSVGTVTESKSAEGLALARVNILGRVSDFLPVMQMANSFKKHCVPIRPGEQVIVLAPFGDGDGGIIVGSLFNKGAKEPAGYSESKEVTQFEDGTVISYDSQAKKLTVNVAATVEVVAQTVNITATTTHTGDVSVAGNLSVDGAISSTGDISTDANVNDVKGSLTNFSTTDGAGRA